MQKKIELEITIVSDKANPERQTQFLLFVEVNIWKA